LTVPVPLLVTLMLCVDVLPTARLPKAMLVADGVRTPPPELPTPPPLPEDALEV
jgi:hypothetical protein